MSKYEIVTVVVTYNRKRILKECIGSLIKQNNNKMKILIIDNNSTDDTYDYIKNVLNKNIDYINTKKNLGGAGGFNFGIKKALKYYPNYIWLMDDDTIVTRNCLKKLLLTANELDNNFSFLSSRVLWTDNSLCLMNKQTISRNWLFNYKMLSKGVIEIQNASFVSCFINVSAIEKVGLPIKDFFIWGDDTEYTERLCTFSSAYYVNESVVIHKSIESNLPDITKDTRDLSRFYYLYRNLYYIYKKNKRLSKFHYLQRKHIKNIIKKSKNKKIRRIIIVLLGGFKGMFFRPKIEYIKK